MNTTLIYNKQGFTLLELLVVLVIIALASSFASPQLWSTYVKVQEQSVVEKYARSIKKIRKLSRKEGRSIRFSSLTKESKIHLPNGWSVKETRPIMFLPSGATSGGEVVFQSDSDRTWKMTLSPLDGFIKIERQ